MFSIHTTKAIIKALITKKSPYYIQFFINGKCNLMCKYCNIVETNSRIKEIDLDKIQKVAMNLRKTGAGIILLSGGEPFMRKDLPEIVSIFIKAGLNVRLQTSGTGHATEEQLQACYDAGARDINVSLDSLEILKSDYINSVAGSGQKALDTIERISSVFRNKSAILSLGTVMSRLNYIEIPAILDFAKKIGWHVSLVPVHITNMQHPKGFRSFDTEFTFTSSHFSKLDKLADQLILMKKQGYPLFDSERFINSSISFLKGKGSTWRKNNICDSPNLYYIIRPDGAFAPCCDYTLKDPPYLFSDEFIENYKNGNIGNREDVQQIIKNCSGCHFGSYPEVTLSVRDWKAFFERVMLVLNSGGGKLKQAAVKTDFCSALEQTKEHYPDIYPSQKWLDTDLQNSLNLWKMSETRNQLIKTDKENRKKHMRERGKGQDVVLGAEQK